MPLRTASFCLLLLTGCATHAEQPVPVVAQTGASHAGLRGIILAMRPVPTANAAPARVLLSGLDAPNGIDAASVYEFIIRTDDGSTISIVQPRMNGMHAGEPVTIVRGAETRIEAAAEN